MVAKLSVSVPVLDTDCSDLRTVEHERMYVAAHLYVLQTIVMKKYMYYTCTIILSVTQLQYLV